jgi:hypothetical protein
MQKKWAFIPVAAAAMGLGTLAFTNAQVSAHGPAEHDTMVTRFAQAFGKSEDEVKAVFEQIREEHESQRQAALTAKLDAGVAAGQITAEQKQLIIDKMAAEKTERQAQFQAIKVSGKKPTTIQFKTKRAEHRAELEAWATQKGISKDFLQSLFERSEMTKHSQAGQR